MPPQCNFLPLQTLFLGPWEAPRNDGKNRHVRNIIESTSIPKDLPIVSKPMPNRVNGTINVLTWKVRRNNEYVIW